MVNREVRGISKDQAWKTMNRMKNGKAVGPDDIKWQWSD